MKLSDLDRVIELAQGINSASKRALGGDYQMKQTIKAVCHDSGEVLWLLRKMRENAKTLRFMGFVDGPTFDKMRADLEDNQDMTVSYGLGFRWESWGWDYEPQLAPCYVGERIGRHSTEDQRPLYDAPLLITPEDDE